MTIKEYLPVTLSAERGADCILPPKTGSEVLFKTTRMDFADLYRFIQRITPANGWKPCWTSLKANNTVYAVMENLAAPRWTSGWKRTAPCAPTQACAMLAAGV